MKILLGQSFLSILSVIILYYLFQSSEFLPYTAEGFINWQNVLVLIFFISVFLINTFSILFIFVSKFLLKKVFNKNLFYKSIRISVFLTLGILIVFILNFLHILNIYYGLAVLTIVIIISLVI